MVGSTADVAEVFHELLGTTNILSAHSVQKMTQFRLLPAGPWQGNWSVEYGLGLMNMTYSSVDPEGGELFGHEGLTYGFHTRSGHNRKYNFTTTYAQNHEECHGSYHDPGQVDPIYERALAVVRQYKSMKAAIESDIDSAAMRSGLLN